MFNALALHGLAPNVSRNALLTAIEETAHGKNIWVGFRPQHAQHNDEERFFDARGTELLINSRDGRENSWATYLFPELTGDLALRFMLDELLPEETWILDVSLDCERVLLDLRGVSVDRIKRDGETNATALARIASEFVRTSVDHNPIFCGLPYTASLSICDSRQNVRIWLDGDRPFVSRKLAHYERKKLGFTVNAESSAFAEAWEHWIDASPPREDDWLACTASAHDALGRLTIDGARAAVDSYVSTVDQHCAAVVEARTHRYADLGDAWRSNAHARVA